MTDIKPIETVYGGYRFRSRLEARWAVFFETLNVPCEYEREGYDLGDAGWYLPDFWLPEHKYWIEVKGVAPSKSEERKARALAVHTENPVFIFWGSIPLEGEVTESPFAYLPDGSWSNDYTWCECTHCISFGIVFDGDADRLPCRNPCRFCSDLDAATKLLNRPALNFCSCPHHGIDRQQGCPLSFNGDYAVDTFRLIKAYRDARYARFEHGETPSPHRIDSPLPGIEARRSWWDPED